MTRYRLLIPLGLFALALAGALWVRSRFQLAGSLLPAASSEEGADDGDHPPRAPTCEPILGTPCPSREAPSGFAVGRGECEAIAPTPVGALCKSRVAGCAGLLRPLCKRACGYCRSLVEGAVCRARHLAAAEGPNAACGRHGMDDEWEPVEPLPVTLVGEVGGGGGRGCPGLPAESGWGLPRYSARDSCFTHLDRDFLFDLAVGAEALPSLSPANLVSDRSHAGRDLEVETEWMYLFAPFRGTRLFAADDTGLAKPAALLPRLRWTDEGGHARDLGVPMPGDPMAAQGVLAADCGHLDASGFARTELHPALALAWLHRESDKVYTLWVRAASHLATDQRSHRLQPLRAVLPLPGPAKVASFSWDYSLSGYRVAIDRSCVFAANGDHQQEHPAAHLEGGVLERPDAPGPPASLHALGAFALRLTPQPGGLLVELWPRGDASPPLLTAARAELVLESYTPEILHPRPLTGARESGHAAGR